MHAKKLEPLHARALIFPGIQPQTRNHVKQRMQATAANASFCRNGLGLAGYFVFSIKHSGILHNAYIYLLQSLYFQHNVGKFLIEYHSVNKVNFYF